jgi:hemerythrin
MTRLNQRIMMYMTKIPVLPGVWWVEIPESDLRILCGAPMDIIKHLMRKGLVKKIVDEGVEFETGPNAILLSDVQIQQGRFWNLAEFPVLHMLYRQGMAIPKHPGNTGRKPLLIGLSDRAEGVISYIHRGTYGLVNKTEMAEAGVPARDMDDLWGLKLKFASGAIKSPHELIDVIPVVDGTAGLPGGVSLERLGLNRYRFSKNGQQAEIDMNLHFGEDWTASYTLNATRNEDGYFSITHIGEGNGWNPERPCMGSMITYRGHRFLIDAGPGIDYSLDALGIDVSEIDGVFVTHVHDDHFAGLTSLLRGDRKRKLFATGPVLATVRLKCAAILEREPDFLDHLVEIVLLEEDVWNDIGGLEVRPTTSPHPLETTIMFFRVLWEGGYRSYAHLADIISKKVLDRFIAPDGITEKFRDRVFDEYHRMADVKKIDAGRGLIHGAAEDFTDDPSTRLILSHTEGSLSEEEKDVGASVSFGQADILIPDRGDRLREQAKMLLLRSVSGMAGEDTDRLLNGTVESFQPGSPLVKKGAIPEHLLLIITGTVDVIAVEGRAAPRFAAGSLIGEVEFLNRTPARTSYRSRNHVRALRIPADIYVHALRKAKILDQRVTTLENREILTQSVFPGHVVSCPRLDDLAGALIRETWKKRKNVKINPDTLYIVLDGSIHHAQNDTPVSGIINARGVIPFLNDEEPGPFKVEESATIAALPGRLIRDIPVLCWTLAEFSTIS